ncbi:MAG: hypothetical protein WCR54_04290 [Clostridia bacterium]
MKDLLVSIGEVIIMEIDDVIDIKYNNNIMQILLSNGERYKLDLGKVS